MKLEKNTIFRLSFYCLWFIAAILQSRYTELFNDEAYYWKYSTMLSWGYFDHPPMVALIIKCGYFFFQNELGVRLIFVILQLATIWLLEKLINPKNLQLFYIAIASIALIHVGGILAIPDIPLLFFSVVFFHAYKSYIEKSSWKNTALLSLAMSLMLMSKYHGILIIGFTVLSNLKILNKGSFWIASFFCLLLISPHILWQIENDYPTIRYQLYERSSEGYTIMNTLEYLLVQPFVFGPFIGIILLYLSFKVKSSCPFERTLKFNLFGIYLFFFLMTIKGRVEAHWTLCALVPLLYLGYQQIENNPKIINYVRYSFPVSLFLILCLRIFMVWDFTPKAWAVKTEFHHYREWANTLDFVAKGRPVAFMNSYQKAAKYEFYSGHEAFSLNNVMGRKNQYTIWDIEAKYQGKEVMLVPNYDAVEFKNLETSLGKYQYVFIKNFRSYSNIMISCPDIDDKISFENNKPMKLKLKFDYTNNNIRSFKGNKDYPSFVSYQFFKGKSCIKSEVTDLQMYDIMPIDDLEWEYYYDITMNPPIEKGKYVLYISIKTGWLPPSINSTAIKAEVR